MASSAIFAGLYYYATLLPPLNGQAIFGWRMLLMVPAVALFLVLTREWRNVLELCQRVRRRPAFVALLCVSSALLGLQQWLFMWAPINGHGLDVSLGYFLLPLVMLLIGRSLYGERLTTLQKLAAFSAMVGVVNELVRVGGVAWPTLVVALGFPPYFILRRRIGTAHTGGLWFDIALTMPIALYFILHDGAGLAGLLETPRLFVLLPVLAILSAAAFICYTVASKLLPFSLFGLLGYVEPVLLVGVALMLGEKIAAGTWMTYLPIWLAVALLAGEGLRHVLSKALARRMASVREPR